MSQPIPVPRSALALTATVVLALVAAVAYLLGRGAQPPVSTPVPQVVLVPSAPPAPVAAAPAVPGGVADPVAPSAQAQGGAEPVAASGAASPMESPPPPMPTAPSGPSEEEREAVRAYFAALELELVAGKSFADPRKHAMGLLEDLSGGGVRDLEKEQRRTRDRVAAVRPPPPCAEHHKITLEAMDAGIEMLEELARRMSANDLAGLDQIASQGKSIEEKARTADALATALKQQFGVTG